MAIFGAVPDRREESDVPVARRHLERVRWWCPDACGHHRRAGRVRPASVAAGWPSRHRLVSCAGGQVLAVRSRAIMNTPGAGKMIFVEEMPGMFNGRRSSGRVAAVPYPVAGTRSSPSHVACAVAGSFLLEPRPSSTPSLAAGYFGASGGRQGAPLRRDRPPPTATGSLEAAPELDALKRRGADRSPDDGELCRSPGSPSAAMGTPERRWSGPRLLSRGLPVPVVRESGQVSRQAAGPLRDAALKRVRHQICH